MDRPWVLDELAYAGPEHLDPDFVAAYDRKQGYPDPTEDIAMFAAHGVGPTSIVVDLGAGPGQFALAAARHVGHVTAVDVSPVMLRLLQDRATEAGLSNLTCVRAGFLSYRHRGAPVDGVYTRNALHHLPDFWKAMGLYRVARMMRPGGVLRVQDLFYDFLPAQAEEVFDRWLDGAVEDPAEGYTREDFATHIRSEHSTYRWLFEPMLTAAGFEIATAHFGGSVYGAYTCLKR